MKKDNTGKYFRAKSREDKVYKVTLEDIARTDIADNSGKKFRAVRKQEGKK